MKEIIKKLFEVFLICHFLISMVVGICGSIMEPDYIMHYKDLFVPALMALFCTLPSLLMIRTDKISMPKLVLRKIVQILIVEGILLSMIYLGAGGFCNVAEFVVVVISVLFVFACVSLIAWLKGCVEAKDLNRRLTQMKQREQKI